jgi:hypothetical protein
VENRESYFIEEASYQKQTNQREFEDEESV